MCSKQGAEHEKRVHAIGGVNVPTGGEAGNRQKSKYKTRMVRE